MMTSTVWLVIKALISLLPVVIAAVRDGKIRAASQAEVLDVLQQNMADRVDKARKAKLDDSLPDPYSKLPDDR